MRAVVFLLLALGVTAQPQPSGQSQWDLLIQGGHVIDPKNGINKPMDVAIAGGKIARVALALPAANARTVVNARGLYVTPGIIDVHVHVYAGTGVKAYAGGDLSVAPDGFSYRTGVTTMVDAGSAGWRNFADFKQRVIDRAKTRVLAFINIVADGMSPAGENDPATMNSAEAARVAKAYPDVVVGFKTAHYSGAGWHSVDRVVEAGNLAGLPVMVDFGYATAERNLTTLLEQKLRPGDIYTHCYAGHRLELLDDGKVNPAMINGRKRGVLFDVGHGGGSFYWNIAVPAIQQGFRPDSISTDLHVGSMNSGMKDMPTTMSKMLNLGIPLADVIRMSTWQSAQEIKHPELGHLTEGATADVALLRVDRGNFGLLDSAGARLNATQRIAPELTIHGGKVVWDLSGRAATDWRKFTYKKRAPAP